MGNEIATKHSKSNIDQFPQIHPLSPQDNFPTKHPNPHKIFHQTTFLQTHLPKETLPIRPIIFNRVPAPNSVCTLRYPSTPKGLWRYASIACLLLLLQPPARQNFRHIGQETSDLSGLGSDSHRATVTHPYRAGAATPIGQEAAQL